MQMIKSENQQTIRMKRPFFLTFLCIIGFTYTILFSLLFLAGMLYSTGISGMLNNYLQVYDLSIMNFFLFSIGGFFIFFATFTGVLLMWKMQWLGFYIYSVSAIIFIALEVIIAGFYLPDIAMHGTFIFLFFISFLYVRKKKRALIKETGPAIEESK